MSAPIFASTMLSLAAPDAPLDPAAQRSPGGYFWWYLDLVGPSGDGVVVIFSWGLPFLPGVTAAARAGAGARAIDRPSVNVAVYERGVCTCFLLQEHDRDDVELHANRLRIGRSTLERVTCAGVLSLRARLDCDLPGGGRLAGEVALEGPARIAASEERPSTSPHRWTPLVGPSRGRVDLRAPGWSVGFEGSAYHDRNESAVGLHGLGIDEWFWAHASFDDRERAAYLLWPEGEKDPFFVGLEIDASGASSWRPLRADVRASGRDVYGLEWPRELDLSVLATGEPWMSLTAHAPVERGPFYLRFICEGVDPSGRRGRGFAEYLRPDRVDLPWQRPVVAMRVHDTRGANSRFLPLFTGPRDVGRVARFLSGLRRSTP